MPPLTPLNETFVSSMISDINQMYDIHGLEDQETLDKLMEKYRKPIKELKDMVAAFEGVDFKKWQLIEANMKVIVRKIEKTLDEDANILTIIVHIPSAEKALDTRFNTEYFDMAFAEKLDCDACSYHTHLDHLYIIRDPSTHEHYHELPHLVRTGKTVELSEF